MNEFNSKSILNGVRNINNGMDPRTAFKYFSSWYEQVLNAAGGPDNLRPVENWQDLLDKTILSLGDPASGWGPQVLVVKEIYPQEDPEECIVHGVFKTPHDQSGEDEGPSKAGDEFRNWFLYKDDVDCSYLVVLNDKVIDYKFFELQA